jgi:hypothetical protein
MEGEQKSGGNALVAQKAGAKGGEEIANEEEKRG